MYSSQVVGYRDGVINAIRATITDLRSVDWYDAIFDEEDLKDWILVSPCALVAARDVRSEPHSTGELNTWVDMVVAIAAADGNAARDADAVVWSIAEQIGILVNYNYFQNMNAAVPQTIRFTRLREPELRRMGVALGIVEWTAGLTIGHNFAVEDWRYRDPRTGEFIPTLPQPATLSIKITNPAGDSSTQIVTASYDDEQNIGPSQLPL